MTEGHHDQQAFAEEDPDFTAERDERVRLVDAFLGAMAEVGNPGTERKLGSFVREFTGQEADEYWAVKFDEDENPIWVFADGRHGWEDNFRLSDRPLSPDREIPPERLADALRAILDANDVPRPDALR
ncbi:MAG TPA: hypothetical protein VGR21_01150 [Cryptosporangiaceae bacterium]|nr:hypothetical protein [Cryptosporangiaceae bacterium]